MRFQSIVTVNLIDLSSPTLIALDQFTQALVDELLTAAAVTPSVPIVLDLSTVKFAPSVALGALVQLTKSLALAWAPDNIQVNAILPGWFDTELTEKARVDASAIFVSS